jgi:hypothetical protein
MFHLPYKSLPLKFPTEHIYGVYMSLRVNSDYVPKQYEQM